MIFQTQVHRLTLQPYTPDGLKFSYFPDIFTYQPAQPGNVLQRFPYGRNRREVRKDPMTGQTYESYEANVEMVGNVPLKNNISLFREGDNNDTMEGEEDEFDDQFEEDMPDNKLLEEFFHQQDGNEGEKSDDIDLSSSRWVAYDTLSSLLDR